MNNDLQAVGAAAPELDELRAYHLQSTFDLARIEPGLRLPLADEPFVACWQEWVEEASGPAGPGAFATLARHLPQLQFPVREGISTSEAYRAATLSGVPAAELAEATGLGVERPECVELHLHPSAAGRIPLLIARGRPEFEALLRALTRRNEPALVPAAQGAQMVAGYNNWARLHKLRRSWEATDPAQRTTSTWGEELARLKPEKHLYQDRFILLHDGPYSAVPAAELGLDEAEWRRLSLLIRREHECSHYLTRRLLGSMRNHALDELIADYAGLTAALGRYRADWFLRFLGLDTQPPRPEGRLHLYRGDPPLSETAFHLLGDQLRAAAHNLQRADEELWGSTPRTEQQRVVTQLALAGLGIEALAGADGFRELGRRVAEVEGKLSFGVEPDRGSRLEGE